YLIEEFIDEEKDGFHKFINNVSAVPVPLAEKSFSNLAEFLSLTQHVQYHKTKGVVYLSDLQGEHRTSSDELSTNNDFPVSIFGDGNVAAAFNAFPEQHDCNKFCHWFKLPVLQSLKEH
ncbi:hypothetical protein B0H14DRAFT_2379304, partial [Mycena olivaceomarginata]